MDDAWIKRGKESKEGEGTTTTTAKKGSRSKGPRWFVGVELLAVQTTNLKYDKKKIRKY